MIMFEIYRDALEPAAYRAAYFTELHEHERDAEISRAMQGESYLGGFLRTENLGLAKRLIADLLDDLNRGLALPPDAARRRLDGHLVE